MKKFLCLLSLLAFAFSNLYAQQSKIKTVHYAQTEIVVPAEYTANDDYSIANNLFSAQWLYLSKEMVEKGVEKQIIQQFQNQLNYSSSTNVSFISNGGQFSGKKYHLKGSPKMKFRILAFGQVNGQPLVLNLGFKDNPKSNEKLDELMKKFITYQN